MSTAKPNDRPRGPPIDIPIGHCIGYRPGVIVIAAVAFAIDLVVAVVSIVQFFVAIFYRAVNYPPQERLALQDKGVFWVDFASVVQHFRHVAMNWNPNIFRFR